MTSPPDLTPGRVFIAAGGIYTAQSLIGGLTFVSVPAILRERGVGLDQIGLVSLVMLPWAFKFLWAPWVEGLRRPRLVITIGEVLAALLLLVTGLRDEQQVGGLLVGLALLALVAASVDIACDAFLITHLDKSRLGFGNVAQIGGGYLGLVFGGGLFTLAVSGIGWSAACALMAGILVLLSLPMARQADPAPHHRANAPPPRLSEALKRPGIRTGILLTLCFEAGGRVAMALGGPFLIDCGAPLSVVGMVTGMAGVITGLAGAAVGGLMVRRLGPPRALRILFRAHLATISLLALIAWRAAEWPETVPAILVESGLMAAGFVVLYSHLMGQVSSHQPGVDFTLFQCASVVTAVGGGYAGGVLAEQAGYLGSFLAAFILTGIGAMVSRPMLAEARSRHELG